MKKILILPLLLLIAFLFGFCASNDNEDNNENSQEESKNDSEDKKVKKPEGYPQKGVVTGTIRQIGNVPFVELVITGTSNVDKEGKKRDYFIKGDLKETLEEYVYKKVKASGTIDIDVIKYAGDKWDPELKYNIEVNSYEIIETEDTDTD
ncbi:MAG: hypothetical protein ACOCV8_03210 [Spirochaetota bacterium]